MDDKPQSSWRESQDELSLNCMGIGSKLKLSLLVHPDGELTADKLPSLFKQLTERVLVEALPCNQMPSAANMISTLNISLYF